MLDYQRSNGHSVSRLTAHLVWLTGFGCWSTGNITDEMVNEYLEYHRKPTDKDDLNFILE